MHKPFEEKKIVMYLRNSFVENVVLQGSAEISFENAVTLFVRVIRVNIG